MNKKNVMLYLSPTNDYIALVDDDLLYLVGQDEEARIEYMGIREDFEYLLLASTPVSPFDMHRIPTFSLF